MANIFFWKFNIYTNETGIFISKLNLKIRIDNNEYNVDNVALT